MALHSTRAWTCSGGYPQGLALTSQEVAPKDHTGKEGQTKIAIDVKAAAINPVDIQRMNLPSSWRIFSSPPTEPAGTGCDFSGTVQSCGRNDFSSGEDVFGLVVGGGTLAQTGNFDVSRSAIAKKPAAWSHEQAAAVPLVWLTAKTCIEDVTPFVESSTSAKRVVVLGGSSATGTYSIIIAKRRGWRVLATSSSRNKDFVLSNLGADEHVDYTTDDVRQKVANFKPDAIIDCVGGTECIGISGNKRYISIVGDKTSRSSMGGPYTYYDTNAPLRMATQWIRWAKGWLGLGESYDVIMLALRQDWLQEATTTLSTDDIFIDSTFEFEKAEEAFERLNTGRARGKVVIKVASS